MYTLVETLVQVPEFQKELLISDSLSIDTETSGLNIYATTWLLLQVKTNNKIFIFDIRKLGSRNVIYIINLIKSSDKLLLFHNAKFDLKVIYLNTGIMLTNVYDSMITEVLINQGVGKQYYSLKELVEKYCGIVLDKETREGFYNYQEDSFSNELLTYAALDVNYLETIYQNHIELIYKSNQKKVYDLEMRLVAPVTDMEVNGVVLDKDAWVSLIKTAELKIENSKKEIIDYILSNIDFTKYSNALETAKDLIIPIKTKKMEKALALISNPEAVIDWFRENININSSLQVKRMFNLLGIPMESTGENELKKIRLTTPLADLLLIHREATKKITTYGEKFLENINPVTGKIHSEFNQVGTQSGRFSCVPTTTQILTKNGWKFYNEVSIGDSVIGFDIQSRKYVETKIRAINLGYAPVGRIKINSGHDTKNIQGIYCTGNHKWVVENNTTIGFSLAEKLPNGFKVLLQPSSLITEEKTLLDNNQAFLLGWYLTDGFTTGKKNFGLGISLAKPRSIDMLEKFLVRNEIPFTKNKYKPYDKDAHYVTAYHISSKIFNEIYRLYYSISPSELIMNLDVGAKESMLSAMLEGDGSIRREKKDYDRFGALEIQKKKTPEVFELLMFSLGKPYSYQITHLFSGKNFINYQILKQELYASKNYKWKPELETDVWCPETDCGTWIMRQGHIIAITGNSDSPNLQNIPKEEEYRHCFVSGEGKVFLCKDYSQQEYRLAGAVSKEDKIIEAYKKGLDMHSATASAIFEIPIEEVTKEQRDKGKTINFSILYGSTKYGLAYKLQVDINVAEKFLQQVEEAFPKLSLFKEMVSNEIWKRKYSCTPLGRKRYFAEKILFSDYKEAQAYEGKTKREGFNHIVQGGGADAVKIAMCDIYYNNPFGDKLKLKMQIHDEIVVEADESIAKEADEFVTNSMINSLQSFLGEIPAKVEGPISKVWRH